MGHSIFLQQHRLLHLQPTTPSRSPNCRLQLKHNKRRQTFLQISQSSTNSIFTSLTKWFSKSGKNCRLQQKFRFLMDTIIAQVNSDESKLRAVVATFEWIIFTAFDQKLVPGALSTDVLTTIVQHIKNVANNNQFHNFVHEAADLYKLDVSFIHHLEEQTVILILHVPFVEAKNLLSLYKFVSLSVHFNFSENISVIPEVGWADLITIGDTNSFQTLSSLDLTNCKQLGLTFSARIAPYWRQISFRTAWAPFFLLAPHSSKQTASSWFRIQEKRFSA